MSYYLGLDLGQRNDHSALVTLTYQDSQLIICALERFPLGTNYCFYPQAISTRVDQIGKRGGTAHLVVDAAGPGAPVIDHIRSVNPYLQLTPITITGARAPGYNARGTLTVPRRHLFTNLVSLMERRKITAPHGLKNWHILENELVSISATTYRPIGPEKHDDLAIAICLAAWCATHIHRDLLPYPPT